MKLVEKEVVDAGVEAEGELTVTFGRVERRGQLSRNIIELILPSKAFGDLVLRFKFADELGRGFVFLRDPGRAAGLGVGDELLIDLYARNQGFRRRRRSLRLTVVCCRLHFRENTPRRRFGLQLVIFVSR